MGLLRSAISAYRNGALVEGTEYRCYDIFYRKLFGDIVEIHGQLMDTAGHWPRPRAHLPGTWHEEPAFSTFIENVENGMNVADVGAGSGWFTLNACDRVRPTGTVYAFEADSSRYQTLKRNLTLNEYENATVVRERIDEDTRVSEYCTDLDFAIIDVEGHEFGVLKGLPRIRDESNPLQILCEIHPTQLSGDTQERLYTLLEESGFDISYGNMGGSFGNEPKQVINELHQIYARR